MPLSTVMIWTGSMLTSSAVRQRVAFAGSMKVRWRAGSGTRADNARALVLGASSGWINGATQEGQRGNWRQISNCYQSGALK